MARGYKTGMRTVVSVLSFFVFSIVFLGFAVFLLRSFAPELNSAYLEFDGQKVGGDLFGYRFDGEKRFDVKYTLGAFDDSLKSYNVSVAVNPKASDFNIVAGDDVYGYKALGDLTDSFPIDLHDDYFVVDFSVSMLEIVQNELGLSDGVSIFDEGGYLFDDYGYSPFESYFILSFSGLNKLINISFYSLTYFDDSDGDGFIDYWESLYGFDPYDDSDPVLTSDGDNDGLSVLDEYIYRTNPLLFDTDGDLVGDGDEILYRYDPLDASSPFSDIDSDGDGLSDLHELAFYNTNPKIADTDGDGYNDGWEIENGFNPLFFGSPFDIGDSDDDLMPDGWELAYGFNPYDASDAFGDYDGDGLSNFVEYFCGTNPTMADTDGDGYNDGWEYDYRYDYLDWDDPVPDADDDGDGLTNYEEYQYGTNPKSRDTDSDYLPDAWEILYGYDPCNDSERDVDTDGDGLEDWVEFGFGGDPSDPTFPPLDF